MISRPRFLPITVASIFLFVSASAQDFKRKERYGFVDFPVSCNSEAQQLFNRAVNGRFGAQDKGPWSLARYDKVFRETYRL
jgi:hypothetical protein